MPKVPDEEPVKPPRKRRHFKDVVQPPKPVIIHAEDPPRLELHEEVVAPRPEPRNDCIVDITTFTYKDYNVSGMLALWLDRHLPEFDYNTEYVIRLQITKVSR